LVNKLLYEKIEGYRETISILGDRLDLFDANDLKKYLLAQHQEIDFMAFCRNHIKKLQKDNRAKTASCYRTVYFSLVDYFGTSSLSIDLITLNSIYGYEQFLQTERLIERKNQQGKLVKTKSPKLSTNSIHNYMRDFKSLFKATVTYYNNLHIGLIRIKYNPFDQYKLPSLSETQKRNIEITSIKSIRDFQAQPNSTAELARDIYMLSFYLCGMNAADLYAGQYLVQGERIEYNRLKTKEKRKDNAFISIKIIDEAKPLLYKYYNLNQRYNSRENLTAAISAGMRQIAKELKLDSITFYSARHSFATIARNKCRKSKDDVAMALNHVDQTRKTTDIYLGKDWTIIDEVQLAVVELLRDLDRKGRPFRFQLQRLFKSKWNNLKFTFRFNFGIYFNC